MGILPAAGFTLRTDLEGWSPTLSYAFAFEPFAPSGLHMISLGVHSDTRAIAMTRFRVLGDPGGSGRRNRLSLRQPGQSGLAFLKLGVSGRGVAMGDALSALVTGAAANYYNPAGFDSANGGGIDVHAQEWIQDTRTEFLGAAVPTGPNNAIGASVSTTTVSDIEVAVQPGPAQGSFTSRDLAVGLSFAHLIAPNFGWGSREVSVREDLRQRRDGVCS